MTKLDSSRIAINRSHGSDPEDSGGSGTKERECSTEKGRSAPERWLTKAISILAN